MAVLSSSVGGDTATVYLAGVETPEQAAALRGLFLRVPLGQAVRPKTDEFFWHEVVGLRVEAEDGRDLGIVTEILRTGANDVYVAQGPLGELLIPAIEDVVLTIDPPSGRLLIRPMPGLLPGDDDRP